MFGINKKNKKPTLAAKSKSPEEPKEISLDKPGKTAANKQTSKQTIVPDLICKSYVEGCLVLGCVHDITQNELIVSLPGIGNFGFIKLNNISKVYNELLKSGHSKLSADSQLTTLSGMFSKGNLVRCKVLSYTNKKLYLTIEPNEVNSNLTFKTLEDNMIISGAVKTKEDHGYTIDLGVEDLSGFLKTDNFTLSLGQCCLFKLASKKTERTISLKLCDSSEESMFYEVKSKYKFDSYLPGSQLTCTVEKTNKNGLQANISNQLFAYVHSNHLPLSKRPNFLATKKKSSDKGLEEKTNEYKNGDKITGTIIFLNPYSKVVYLSLLPHLTNSTKTAKIARLFLSDEENLKLGQVVEDAQVATHSYKGLYVKFKGANLKQVIGFIPKRHLFEKVTSKEDLEEDKDDDEDESGEEDAETKTKLKKTKSDAKNMSKEDLEKSFPLNSTIKARIYDFSLIEDIILLSHRKSVLNAPFMLYSELSVGQVVKCKVKGVNPLNGGVNVYLSDFISAFIPKIHTGDMPLSDTMLARKFKRGDEIKCKVIQLEPESKRCVLSAKKTLIKSKLPLLDSFSDLKLGFETYGTVVSIQKYGLLLSFLNDLKGLLPRQQISTSMDVKSEDKDLKEIFYVGQLIKCKVFKYDSEKNQVKLSLLMKDSSDSKPAISEKPEEEPEETVSEVELEADYEIGDLIETATILQVNEENQYFRLKLPRGQKNGIIYKNHLSDMDCLNDILFECYKRQMQVKNLMITQYSNDLIAKAKLGNVNKNKQCHYLTLKTTLIEHYTKKPREEIPKCFADLNTNDWHHGWIKKILTNGLLVEIPYNLTGFTSNQEVSYLSELKASITNGITIGQSVLIKVGKLFQEQNQFITSIRTRHSLMQTNQTDLEFMIELFKSYLTNKKQILTQLCQLKPVDNTNVHPNQLVNRNVWEAASSRIRVGSVVKVVVKRFNPHTLQAECNFVDELNEQNNYESNLIGVAFAESSLDKKFTPGAKFEALILAFDPMAKVFCLTVEQKQIKTYRKNFDAKFCEQSACKPDQLIKAEILYVSQWFCIVGLKAHALGRLAFMPLFRNDFTQLNTHKVMQEQANKFDIQVENQIKQQQLLKVSTASLAALLTDKPQESNTKKNNSEDKHFAYYCVGQVGKVCVKFEGADQDYLIVVHDLSTLKQNRKGLLRQLAILNENHATNEGDDSLKRKTDENDEPILIKKKLVLDKDVKGKRKLAEISNSNETEAKDFIEIVTDVKGKQQKAEEIGNGVDFPWEVNDFDQFNKILNTLNPNDSKENDPEDAESDKKKKKQKTIKKDFVNDKDLIEIEEKAFDPNRAPETIEDYERMLAAEPNNSLLWIKYMAFHLQIGETEKARDVAHKALKTIIYREEAERLNVWVALLNMETLYGTQAHIDDAFNRANQNCDSFKVHSHMAEIYARNSKLQEAEDVFMKMTRKFTNRQDVWIKYAVFHYKNANCELARKLLIRSLGSLEKKEHVEMVNKFAQLEFKYGDIERAKTMYDSLLFTYPNRTDIWSVYIDMLVKHDKKEDARSIFNRIIQLGLTAKRMRFIFKKYLDFEKLHGNEDLIEKVKEQAIKYVENNNTNGNKPDQGDNHQQGNASIQANLIKNLKI